MTTATMTTPLHGRKFVPGPIGKPLVGSLIDFQNDALSFVDSAVANHGDVVRWGMGIDDWYMLSNPAHVFDVLVKRAHLFYKPKIAKRLWRHFLGMGILSNDGESWKRQHKLVKPGFHRHRIEAYGETMVRYSAEMAAEWRSGQEIDMCVAMTELTLAVVCKTLFDADVKRDAPTVGNAIRVLNEALTEHIHMPLPVPKWWPSATNRRKHRAIEDVEGIVRGFIEQRRTSGEDRGDLLSMLVFARDDSGAAMSDKQLRDEAMTLVFAGHETTANALTWLWYLLAKHPEVEQKLARELEEALGGRPATVSDLGNLPYLDQVVKEGMRILPSVWCYMREPIEDVQIGDYVIPKGGQIFICPYVIHRDPRNYEDPLEFRPERWTKEMEARLPRGAYVPFSLGPRVCIGKAFAEMEARLVLATLMQHLVPQIPADYEPEFFPKLSLSPKTVYLLPL